MKQRTTVDGSGLVSPGAPGGTTSRAGRASAFVRAAWRLTAPYWRSEERWRARALLAVIVALTLGLVFLLVLLNDWNRQFYEALQDRNLPAFGPLLLRFCILAALFIVGAVYKLYFTQMLQMRWRVWMTQRFLGSWLDQQVYYRLELEDDRTDNPDQRIADDLRLFTANTLDLSLGLLSSVVTLVSFVAILWAISGPLTFSVGQTQVTIPGYMVWAALLYAVVGSLLTDRVGRPLIGLNFQQQRYEADFRFGLARLRENAEGVALYGGEPSEKAGLLGRFERVRANWWQLMNFTKRLTFFTVGYDQVAIVFPILVAAPRYFASEISLGVLLQISNAFGQVQGSLSWFIGSYSQLAGWKATVDRLLTFQQALERSAIGVGALDGRIERLVDGNEGLSMEHLDLGLPNGRVVLADTAFAVEPGDRVLLTGPTGVGKSTLFRAIAGIWPYGRGQIRVPAKARLLFLPQRPYIPIATLRDAVSFPAASGTFGDDEIREVLHAAKLDGFVDRLDEEQNWSMLMSGGEQQRLALARAVLLKPDWLFLDEATAALDEAGEQELYELLQQRLPQVTLVSIAHRPKVAAYHQKQFRLAPSGGRLEPIAV